MLLQRLFLGAWALLALAMIYVGFDYEAPFSYEPVGPRAFPILMLTLLIAGLIYMIVRPVAVDTESEEPPMTREVLIKVALCTGLLLAFALLFEPLGFIPSAALTGLFIARLYGGPWKASLITAVLLSLGLYVLFDRFLDVPLPLGIFG